MWEIGEASLTARVSSSINPEIGDLIIGSHGLRKIRWKCKGKGKKGGARIIYYLVTQEDWILFLTAFSKNEKDDLTKEQIKILCKMVEGD